MSKHDKNRVLSRMGARELDELETHVVNGAVGTKTLCTAPEPPNPRPDGDVGEC